MLEDDVASLLEDFGSDLTLERPGAPTYNPATGEMASASDATLTVRGVLINYMDGDVDGTVVLQGDRRMLVSAIGSDGAPERGDIVGGAKIVDVRTIAPNGTAIAWACQVRA